MFSFHRLRTLSVLTISVNNLRLLPTEKLKKAFNYSPIISVRADSKPTSDRAPRLQERLSVVFADHFEETIRIAFCE